ncbi:MAG: hypothetical protein JO297_17370 [Nitrososphaeraceae archaeon]|nr:hypothetical protein [Nitrososphaeraceae archaeon]
MSNSTGKEFRLLPIYVNSFYIPTPAAPIPVACGTETVFDATPQQDLQNIARRNSIVPAISR